MLLTPGRRLAAALAAFVLAPRGGAQQLGQGPKLYGDSAISQFQGYAIAISSDGSTALVGAPNGNSGLGGAWAYTKTSSQWSAGTNLVGTGAVPQSIQGNSVALSADGSTAISGAPNDNGNAGAAWVFTRSGSIWSQQGPKLTGAGASGAASFGTSVAISGDGNTAIVGGPDDASGTGAFWVFTRNAGVWSPQGGKLVANDTIGAAQLGHAAALSSDGNTAVLGGRGDNGFIGAAWVFTRSGSTWSKQAKLIGTNAATNASQGGSVALSGDGLTALVGGSADGTTGAAWVFTRSGGTWSQQGPKLVGTGGTGNGLQAQSVALSGNGNAAVLGAPGDSSYAGTLYVFRRAAGIWTQSPGTFSAAGAEGNPQLGYSVAMSSDANTIVAGGPYDRNGAGAAWLFSRLCARGDQNGSGAVDVSDVFYMINYLFAGGPAPACD